MVTQLPDAPLYLPVLAGHPPLQTIDKQADSFPGVRDGPW